MKNPLRFMHVMLLATIGMLFACTLGVASESDEEILVGRIAHVEGKLLRYIEESQDWVNTVKDSPFGLDDALYSGDEAKAEMIMPNKTWLRVGENTQIQLIDLNSGATTMDVAAGLARLYNKSDDGVIKVTTPFGYVVAPAGTVFDLYVGDESLEVIAVRGNVDFVHEKTKTRYEVWEGSSSLIADGKETAQGNGMVDSDWDDWNGEREALWTKRLRKQNTSMDLLPEPIRDQSYVLEENGQWERVHYEGAYRDMWRPTRIDPGWRPFTAGRWTVYYGDNCWIPDESFGYVTHHYGSWVYVESYRNWYWMPPVARFIDSAPGLSISFAWFPGRVGWLHSGPSIGWVPLAPDEVYYGYRHWGRRTVVIKNTTVVNINIDRYRYIDEAVIIDRNHFYRGSRYTPYIQRDIGRDVIVNNYQPTTVINNTIINNINIDKRRHTYNDIEVTRKPHTMVIDRINDNQRRKKDFGQGNRERIEKDLLRVNAKAEPSPKVELHKPRLSTKLVGVDDIAKPLSAQAREKNEIKPKERERPVSLEKVQRIDTKGKGEPGQVGRPNARDENIQEQPPQTTKIKQQQRQEQVQDQQIPDIRDDKEHRQRNRGEAGGAGDINPAEAKPRLKSPREVGDKEETRPGQKDVQLRQQADNQALNEQKMRLQQEEGKRRQELEMQQQQKKEPIRQKAEPVAPATKLQQEKQQEELQRQEISAQGSNRERRQRNRGEADGASDINTPDAQPRLQSPRDLSNREENRPGRNGGQLRQQENPPVLNEQVQQRQQKDEQRRQQQEVQQRQQKDEQQRQQQEVQQRQQKDEQQRQQQEVQQRQQKDEQRRQQQEVQQRQQKDEQQRQQQEVQQRQQKDEQQRQQQEIQQRQQKDEQRRQQQEVQQRQKQDHQRQQDESAKQQEQAVKQKKKKQQEEEQQKENQPPPGAGG